MKYIFCVAMLGSPTKAVPSAHVSFQQRHNTVSASPEWAFSRAPPPPHLQWPRGWACRGLQPLTGPKQCSIRGHYKSQKEITRTASAGVLPQVALTSSLSLAPSSPSCIPPEASASPGLVSMDSDPLAASSKF